jgi:hypothetical protein
MRHTRKLKVYNSLGYDSSQPLIRLQGLWLQTAGFQVGDYIKVQVQYGELLIKIMSIDDASENK